METQSKEILTVHRVIHAKRDRVFEAWTNPEIMSKWFVPGSGKAVVKNDFRVDGTFENSMIFNSDTGCGTTSETNTFLHTGKYLEIVPPEKLVFTWTSHLVTNSKVTLLLKDLGDSTDLTIIHELLDTQELRDMHNDGWTGCLESLAQYLE